MGRTPLAGTAPPEHRTVTVLLVGDTADPHIGAVTERLPREGTVVVDAASLPSVLRQVAQRECVVNDLTGEPASLTLSNQTRGWIRRLAPASWDNEVVLGTKNAARLAARMTALAAMLRQPGTEWVCGLDALFAAENKIVQYQTASALGLRTPPTLIDSDPAVLASKLGNPFIIKPLGPGNFTGADGHEKVIHTQAVTAAQLAGTDLLDAPFLAQQLLTARTHLRVVTVAGHAWTAELNASGLPIDWREVNRAHHSFLPSSRWPTVERDALRLARELKTGITSQDWIVDDAGPAFIDLNPGGQWLFLPSSLTTEVADHLANWLQGK
ncbi:RimK family alpha-L-glutamate ligase [Streptomyces sp. NBC_00197]|uniref:ATP-grasp domain-containing protein n=1 Tax=Streptomyces sp. NBC_00197 TaxID=2975676 RepID=UPI00324384A7